MKEYKIVATRDEHHLWNDSWVHMEAVPPVAKTRFNWKTRDLAKAEEWLEELKVKCPEFDAETQSRSGRNSIHYYQSNLRIMTREVSEWEDLNTPA